MLPSPMIECSVCRKTFSTKSHLQRHEAAHGGQPSTRFTCVFCDRSFLRRDVLRRHFTSCKHKGSRPVPGPLKRGRKRKACNACAEARTCCDGDSPCESCLQKGLSCSFSRTRCLENSSQTRTSGSTTAGAKEDAVPNARRMSMSFLLHCTEPAIQTPYDLHHVLARCNFGDPGVAGCSTNPHSHDPDIFVDAWTSLFHSFIDPAALETPQLVYNHSEDETKVVSRLLNLINQFHFGLHGEEASVYAAKAESLFCPTNVTKFVDAFFASMHDINFIHIASIRLTEISAHLLLAILLMGATYASPADASEAVKYAELAENVIFEGSCFQRLLYDEAVSLYDESNLEILQAAVLIILLQMSRNDIKTRRRIRVQRYPCLVSAVRSINLTRATNGRDSTAGPLGWRQYFLNESLVRTMAAIYLLDCYFVIFHRNPPHFRAHEMAFDIPHRDGLYNCLDPSKWEILYEIESSADEPAPIKTVIPILMSEGNMDDVNRRLLPRTSFGQFLILASLHCILFDLIMLHACTDDTRVFAPIDRALNRWKDCWDMSRAENGRIYGAGFVVHALEYWWVAKRLIQEPAASLGAGNFRKPLLALT
ncbi:hypothetical protein BDW68DRAFT_190700 [Aspergillus falconensis]